MENNDALLLITAQEHASLIRILRLTLTALRLEYSTRTGFFERETEALIEKLGTTRENKVSLTDQEILHLRQDLVEVLYGIDILDFESQFDLSREGVEILFQIIERYGKQYRIWN